MFVDRTCGHIDRFVEIMFRTKIDDLETQKIIDDDRLFERLCRVISLTEKRGYRQVEILLNHPIVKQDAGLMKIFRIIEQDEPSHWEPYDGWLKAQWQARPEMVGARRSTRFIHSELLFLKLPALFLNPRLRRRSDWADSNEEPRLQAAE